uniref:Uncharacterized protein n=1 Tax=Tanacetum cinerariifolium TaxID=118510 RepID=A0A699WZ97_TANCI|nr:hypothetical protein [Tanacetum cinerariifolium]
MNEYATASFTPPNRYGNAAGSSIRQAVSSLDIRITDALLRRTWGMRSRPVRVAVIIATMASSTAIAMIEPWPTPNTTMNTG